MIWSLVRNRRRARRLWVLIIGFRIRAAVRAVLVRRCRPNPKLFIQLAQQLTELVGNVVTWCGCMPDEQPLPLRAVVFLQSHERQRRLLASVPGDVGTIACLGRVLQ